MNYFTIDASVIIKWIFRDKENEEGVYQALELLHSVKNGKIKIIQPIHWLAEVAAVITHLQPTIAEEVISLLDAFRFQTIGTPEVFKIACQLSDKLDHHLFDTLYHAVPIALGNAELITADDKYYKKAFKKGAIVRLHDLQLI